MCKMLGVEDVIANALIELIEKKDIRRVSMSQLNSYGMAVVRLLNKKQEEAILLLSKDHTDQAIYNYSDFFEFQREDDTDYICLKDGKTIDELRQYFRAYITVDMLLAFISAESVVKLGVS